MTEQDEITSIKMVQNMTKSLHEVAVTNIRIYPLLIFKDAETADVYFSENLIEVVLHSFDGIKGLWYKFKYRNKGPERQVKLTEWISYWLPVDKSGKKMDILIRWEN